MVNIVEEIYRSENGDCWRLTKNRHGKLMVQHEANVSSGGHVTEMEPEEFLRRGGSGPEYAALRYLLEKRSMKRRINNRPADQYCETEARYTLYYSPGAASMAVHWMLIEIAESFDAVLTDIDIGQQREPEYLALNPAGRVPTLVVDGVPQHESTALMLLLAERHPEANLAPAVGSPERAGWLEWMVYLANTVMPAMRDWFYADVDGDPAGASAVRSLAQLRIEGAWDRLDERLGEDRVFLIGSGLTTVDLLATMLLRWSRNMPRPATDWQQLGRYIERMRAMPSFIEVNRREGLTDWQNNQISVPDR